MLRQMLERAGYEVFDATDGNEGINICRQYPVKLVITDILMPEKDGIETIAELQQEYPGIKIIAMSGGGRITPEKYLGSAEKFGALRTLTKPFTMDEVLRAVKELI